MDATKYHAALLAIQAAMGAETTEELIAHAKLWEAYIRADDVARSADPANDVGSDMDEYARHMDSLGFAHPSWDVEAAEAAVTKKMGYALKFGAWPIDNEDEPE